MVAKQQVERHIRDLSSIWGHHASLFWGWGGGGGCCVVGNGNYDLVRRTSCVMDCSVYLVQCTRDGRFGRRWRSCGQSLYVLVAGEKWLVTCRVDTWNALVYHLVTRKWIVTGKGIYCPVKRLWASQGRLFTWIYLPAVTCHVSTSWLLLTGPVWLGEVS